MAYRHISLPQPFVHGDPEEWFKRFEICCRADAWNDDAKAANLPTLLEGEALAVWLELEKAEQGNYQEVTLVPTRRLVRCIKLGTGST